MTNAKQKIGTTFAIRFRQAETGAFQMKIAIAGSALACLLALTPARGAEIFVSPDGHDAQAGTLKKPLRTLAAAQQLARTKKSKGVTIYVRAGTYYLPAPLIFTAADSGTQERPIVWQAYRDEKPVLSGGARLDLQWEPYRDGIMQAKTPAGLAIDQLFVNGQRQMMARYPNFNPNVRPYNGYSRDAFSKERAARWADPTGGFIHAMHSAHWGGYHYRITGKDANGQVTYEGGWQNNRQMGMRPEHRFVENLFEELDAPGEWFHNAKTGALYFCPPAGADLKTATVEAAQLRHLVEFNGAKHITLRGFILRHAARTFMDTKEPLLRSDWTIYRGGALLFQGAEDCMVADCELDQLGGNAIFVNGYNRRIRVVGCDMRDTGASAVAFVGDPKSVRNPLFNYAQRQDYAAIDKTPGPKTEDYPADCVVEDCLIRRVGLVEKQAAGVQISIAMGITVRHCSIYNTSRAGINISEGTFGGHVIEFCDVFDTVRETGDHGSFNSWGRDRYWELKGATADEMPKLALLDAVKPTVIRNSRWRCDHGWDVDLDDGSSNYEIYNNLFLNGGLKLREGFHRRVWNNIAINNTLHPHVWFVNSGDIVTNNIWMGAYRPALMHHPKWGKEVDRNLFTSEADRVKFIANGCDAHSLAGDPMFVDPANGDYRVKDGSPALKLGFQNFPMDKFGVQKPALKAQARTPQLPNVQKRAAVMKSTDTIWQGVAVRNLEGEEFSSFGVSKESGGVHLKNVPANSSLAKAGLQKDDLIQQVNGQPVRTVAELLRAAQGDPLTIQFVRSQAIQTVKLTDYVFVVAEQSASGVFTNLVLAATTPISSVTTHPANRNEPVAVLTDGKLAGDYGPIFENGLDNGMYRADLGKATALAEINTWTFNHADRRGTQNFRLYGSATASDPGWNVSNANQFELIAEVNFRATDRFLATSVRRSGGGPIGTYRWLVWMTQPVTALGENTSFQEIQIKPAAPAP